MGEAAARGELGTFDDLPLPVGEAGTLDLVVAGEGGGDACCSTLLAVYPNSSLRTKGLKVPILQFEHPHSPILNRPRLLPRSAWRRGRA